ncbi:ABC transporter permease [Chitinimonas arctica]|uniref:ABC transporter permease n=1 Tax=Chitinimonas arctica TaxID=2594795 RepID=A0A516SAM6_9NEIS|nr:ABC transporter permease [Chitinimonas arctica]QDQ25204.1 ABC transporter permease [Chitinimonas arctica]
MTAYLIRRIWQMIPTMIGVMLLVFVIFNVFGADPSVVLAGKIPSKEKIAAIQEQLGLLDPWWMQLLIFAKQVVTFDFGRSWSTNETVSSLLMARAPVTLTVMLQVWVLDALIAVSLASWVAYRRGSLTDRAVVAISTAAMSISLLLYVVIGQYVFGRMLGWFPVSGWASGDLWANITRYAPLPVFLMLLVSVAPSLRLYRSFVVEETNQDYVRTARAKGAGEGRVMVVHVLRNAAVPIVTNLGMQLPGLLIGSFLIEKIFSIPGVGGEIVVAVSNNDFPIIKAITVYTAMATMIANLLVDVLYKWLDPRVEFK